MSILGANVAFASGGMVNQILPIVLPRTHPMGGTNWLEPGPEDVCSKISATFGAHAPQSHRRAKHAQGFVGDVGA